MSDKKDTKDNRVLRFPTDRHLSIDYDTQKINVEPRDNSDAARLERIRGSLERINALMAALKEIK